MKARIGLKALLGSAALTVISVSAAHALTFNGSFSLSGDYGSTPRLTVLTNASSGNFSFNLDVGQSTTFNLFHIFSTETNINNPTTVAKSMLASLALGGGGTGTVNGATVAVRTNPTYYGQVSWSGPIDVNFGKGGVVRFALSDKTFNAGNFGLTTGSANGADVQMTATYMVAPVPLPAAGLLLIGGLGAIAGLRRRKRA